MIYAGWMVVHGAIPYRDFFDMNMPGTYFIMAAMGRIFGWSDFGFRVFDLLCLASISISTLLWMRQFGNLPALAASVAFPLWYLACGPGMSVQREYLALVPFAVMLTVATADTRCGWFNPVLRNFSAGLLTGMAILIKPQFLLLSLPILIVLLQSPPTSVSMHRRAVAFIGGISIPLSVVFLYLLYAGGLRPFVDMAINYWPLYTHMSGGHEPISGLHRFLYIVGKTLEGLMTFHAPMAVVGLMVLSSDKTQHERYGDVMIGSLIAAAAIYPALSGQFWGYHWIPFTYMALCAASLAARVVPVEGWNIAGIVPIIAVILMLLGLSAGVYHYLQWPWENNDNCKDNLPKGGVPDEVCRFLRTHLKAGDTVQPLDWTGGAIHGMLMAQAPLATRFMYDFHFYHHISNPYIGKLRREFINELVVKKPRFIIQVLKNKPWPTGRDTTREFPELQAFLEQHYTTVKQGTGTTYKILERLEPE